MTQTRCPHCGADNFTMEGWEDLDHCSSCGKPLGELDPGAVEQQASAVRRSAPGSRRNGGGIRQRAKKPRPA